MPDPEWTRRGKTVAGIMSELQSFEDQNLEVRISIDDGRTSLPISLVAKVDGRFAMLLNCQREPEPLRHGQESDEDQ